MIYKCSQCGHDDFVRRLDDANWCANCLVAEVRRFRGTPSAEVAEMVKRLREGATVLDEPFHRQAISDTMEEAAALLSKVGQGWVPVSERLPEKGHDARCLCWIIKRHGTGDFGWIGLRAFHHERQCWLNNTVENIESDGERVLYWMPLPPPPERP